MFVFVLKSVEAMINDLFRLFSGLLLMSVEFWIQLYDLVAGIWLLKSDVAGDVRSMLWNDIIKHLILFQYAELLVSLQELLSSDPTFCAENLEIETAN